MARQFMGGDFRAISKAAPVAAEPQPDPRLALVEQFATAQAVADPEPVPTEFLTAMTVDLASMDIPVLTDVFVEDSQEPAEEPQEDGTQDSPAEPGEAAEPEPTTADEDAEPEPAPKVKADDADYDPIAAVLG